MLSINFNRSVLCAQNNLNNATSSLSKALNRMSTGFKINSAADDAAGMFVATNLNTQIRGLQQAQKNVNDGMSLINMADGVLADMQTLLNRMRDLAVQGANGIYSDESRNAMQSEADALTEEIFRLRDSANFNGKNVFTGSTGTFTWSIKRDSSATISNTNTQNASDPSVQSSYVDRLTESEAIAQGYTIIKTADDLNNIRNDMSGKYILMGDIDLSSVSNWDPIGDYNARDGFSGELNGNGYTIKNLKINRSDRERGGLFGYTSGAVIENLSIQNADVTVQSGGILTGLDSGTTFTNVNTSGRISTSGSAGGIAMQTTGKMSNCFSTATVKGASNVGGLVGNIWGDNVSISNCFSTGNVTATVTNAGGITGSSMNGIIENCYATGNIIAPKTAGGITGNNNATIRNCYATGDVTVSGSEAGGIVGWSWLADGSSISNCYSTGKVSGQSMVGGLIGGIEKGQIISNCFWNTETSGQTEAAGIVDSGAQSLNNTGLTSAEIKNPDSYKNLSWDENIWDMNTVPPTLKNMPVIDSPSVNVIRLQVGANSDSSSAVSFDIGFELGNFSVDFSTADNSANSLNIIDSLLEEINTKRSEYGAMQNRLESVMQLQISAIENLTASKSTIMDADLAEESAKYVKNQILQQTTSVLLVQAQRSNSEVIMRLIS